MKGKKTDGIQTFHHEPEGIVRSTDGRIRVAVYCRVSTLHEEQELSFETQCSYYTRLIDSSPDKDLVGIYADQGMSGLHMENRTELQRLLEDCRNGLVDMVITKSVSRFSRNMSECQRTVEELRRLGIRIFFEREHVDTSDPSSEFFLSILASMAQEESNSLSQNQRWASYHNAEQGTPTRIACYGYRRVVRDGKKTKQWEIVPDEAEMIRRAFRLALEGKCYSEIAEELNRIEKERGTNGRWYYCRLHAVFRNEAYKGDILTHKHVKPDLITGRQIENNGEYTQFYIEEHHEPIVSPEDFDKVCRMTEDGSLDSRPGRRRKRR